MLEPQGFQSRQWIIVPAADTDAPSFEKTLLDKVLVDINRSMLTRITRGVFQTLFKGQVGDSTYYLWTVNLDLMGGKAADVGQRLFSGAREVMESHLESLGGSVSTALTRVEESGADE